MEYSWIPTEYDRYRKKKSGCLEQCFKDLSQISDHQAYIPDLVVVSFFVDVDVVPLSPNVPVFALVFVTHFVMTLVFSDLTAIVTEHTISEISPVNDIYSNLCNNYNNPNT